MLAETDIKRPFFARRAKKGLGLGRSPPQELEEGPRSGPHLLVLLNIEIFGKMNRFCCYLIFNKLWVFLNLCFNQD